MSTHWLVSLMIVAGCAVDEVEVTSTSEHGLGGTVCPPWMCQNSPEVLYNGLHELHLGTELNPQGFRLEYDDKGRALIFVGGARYQLHVEDNRITAVGYDGTKISGAGLIGAEMHVLRADNSSLYNLRINNVRLSSFPIAPHTPIEYYTLGWLHPNTGTATKPACNGGTAFEEYSLLGMNADESLIFVGDRINGDRLTISTDWSKMWMTIGCAGHTLAKLHQTRNTSSSNIVPDWAGNQATLKMLAADYCGDGTPWTITGTRIRWMGGQVGYMWPPGKLEARWNEYGALCYYEPRIQQAVPPWFAGGALHKLRISQHCRSVNHSLQRCLNTDPWDLAYAKRISALPL